MTKTNKKTVATNSVDNFIRIGKKKFTKTELAEHGVAVYEKMYLNNEQQLEYYRELGNIFIQIRLSFGNNNNKFGAWLKTSPLNIVTAPDRSDCKKIAENWDKVQKLLKAGKLSALGVNNVRKDLTDNYPELKKANSAGNTSKNKKATTKAKPVALPKNEQELAAMVQKIMQQEGFNKASFTKELNKLYKK
tara:strand:- start:81 stop:653 length:573 start_codon:yes stop_codon:yes gene_type:complete